MMITQHSVIFNNYRMIKKLAPAHAQAIVCMIPPIKEVFKWSCLTIFDAVQCRKFGTEYQRSMGSAQNHHFMVCFQFKQVKVFKTLHFGPMHNLSKCRNETYPLMLPQQRSPSIYRNSDISTFYIYWLYHCYLP